jgi:hypothetical protein
VASFKTSRILCLASSRNERFDTFLALPARSFVAANERLNMVRRDAIDLAFQAKEEIVAVLVRERDGGGESSIETRCWKSRGPLYPLT